MKFYLAGQIWESLFLNTKYREHRTSLQSLDERFTVIIPRHARAAQ